MTDQICPRARENGATLSMMKPPFNGEMVWRDNDTCSYCGSYNPDQLMARLEAGDIQLGPTDKDYKVYIENSGGEPLSAIKFYFQHFDEEQKHRFIELHNEGKLKIGMPGHFYRLPFFCRRED